MENKKIVELSVHEDSNPEELKKAHTSKASNLEMRKDKTTSSPSEPKEFLIDISDPEEPKKANTDKVSTMMEVECPNEDLNREELEESVMQVRSTKILIQKNLKRTPTPRPRHRAPSFTVCLPEADLEQVERAYTLKARNSENCIYEVPRDLRKINKEAYTPQVVSIGPLHHRKEEYLIEMENQKSRYERKFIERVGDNRLEEFENYISVHERKICACYKENLKFASPEFVKMILRDVVFLFELFLRNDQAETRSEFDNLLDPPIRKAAIKLDLQLLENQLPYFLLKELFLKLGDRARPSGGEQFRDPFLILALRFFYDSDQDHLRYLEYDLQHFTDLRRRFLLKEFSAPDKKEKGHIRDLRCASRLHGSGVKFKKSIEDRSSLEIRCEYIKRPLQQKLVLEIPRFEVYGDTECLIRNVMAFEQLHYPWETHVCDYIHMMDSLIDTEKDVDLLVEKGIIVHGLGDNAAVANMFNKLGLQVAPSASCYYGISEKLKAHYGKPWNHAQAALKNINFDDPWVMIGTIATVTAVVLTLVQTVMSVLSAYLDTKL